MKKGVVGFVVLLLLSSLVSAISTGVPSPNEDVNDIKRITNFETDNVHILRIGNFSRAVVKEVSALQATLKEMQDQLNTIKTDLDALKKSQVVNPEVSNSLNQITGQIIGIESEVTKLNKDGDKIDWVSLIIIGNVFILLSVGIVFVTLRKHPAFDEKSQGVLHAKLHLNNDVRNALKRGASIDNIRQSFVRQGWKQEMVDEALHEAIKR